MDRKELASALVELTGSLEPGQGSTEADLQAVRVELARALLSGQSVEIVRFAASQHLAAVAALHEATVQRLPAEFLSKIDDLSAAVVQETADGSQDGPVTLAFLRTTPVQTGFDFSIPSWARGMKITRSFGPFLGPGGIPVWVDFLQTVKLIPFVRGVGNNLIGLFPIEINGPGNTRRHLNLGKGSVWITARQLANLSPGNAFAGFRIKGGTLDLNADLVVVNQVVHIPPTALCKLTVDLDPPLAPPVVNGPGVDATRAVANLPTSVTIEFAPVGAQVTVLPDFSATIYGTTVALKKNAEAARYESQTRDILIPCDATPSQFGVAQHQSALFFPDKSAPVAAAGWVLPVALTTPDKLGEAAGAGAISMELGVGIQAGWTGLGVVVPFQVAVLYLSPGQLAVLGTVKGKLSGKPLVQTFELWDEMPVGGKARSSSIDFQYSGVFDVFYFSVTGTELLLTTGAAVAHLDRPLRADGTRFAVQSPTATLGVVLTFTGQQVIILGNIAPPVPLRPVAIALENALLKIFPPEKLFLNGSLQNNTVLTGTLSLSFVLRSILPTLSDPYAANFSTRGVGANDTQIGLLSATINWPAPDQPQLAFAVAFGAGAQHGSIPGFALVGAPAIDAASMATRGGFPALLDVSSNADQLGVALLTQGDVGITIDNLALAAVTRSLAIFTVPNVSWEPMVSDPAALALGDFPVPLPPDDGGPTVLQVPTAHLSPIEPVPLLAQYISSVNSDAVPIMAEFSLPFGLRAHVEVVDLKKQQGQFQLNQPAFSNGLTGGLQLTMTPPWPFRENAFFPGYTEVVPPVPPSPPPPTDPGYGADVLSYSVAEIFTGDFGPAAKEAGVPVRRIDLSGYGASIFSEWLDPTAVPPAIVKVQFETLVGRTAYEVVKAVSILYPCKAQLVRTITVERQAAGWIFRQDSGWQPVTPGEFKFDDPVDFPANRVHPGAVLGFFNIRRIRETNIEKNVLGATFRQVLFDADVKINPNVGVVAGAFRDNSGNTFVPSTDMVGYVQTAPDGMSATRQQLAGLLSQTGPLGGPVSCVVNIGITDPGAPAAQMKGTVVDVSTDGGPDPSIVAALRGSPLLPRDGAWSLGRKMSNQPAPTQLDPMFPVPLVQNSTDANTWHLADPTDISRLPTPFTQYGFLQSTGTQKMFFAQPQIAQGQASITIPQLPHLADVGALLNATGIFPDLDQALAFNQPQSLDVKGDGLAIEHTWPLVGSSGELISKTLVDFGLVKVVANYSYPDPNNNNNPTATIAHIKFDPTAPVPQPRWVITLTQFSFDVTFTPLGSDPILQIYGTAYADANTAPTLTNLNVVYGGVLSLVESVFSNLQFLAKFLPGGGDAGLDVSFSQGKLTVRSAFALPELPLGIGEITDVAVDLGMTLQLSPQALEFTAGIGSQQKPFHWLVSPLSGTGVVQVGAKNGDLALLIQGGLGVGLSIDVGIASGAASIVLAVQVDTSISPLNVTGILTGNASVDVLDGLASVSLTLSAGLGLSPQLTPPPLPPPVQIPSETITFTASVQVGIHISVCWVADVDFDGYWQFSQTITTPSINLPI